MNSAAGGRCVFWHLNREGNHLDNIVRRNAEDSLKTLDAFSGLLVGDRPRSLVFIVAGKHGGTNIRALYGRFQAPDVMKPHTNRVA